MDFIKYILKRLYKILNLRKNPYTENENKFKYIYIHIPKTGGNGICKSLFNIAGEGHKPLIDYYNYNPKKFEEYYKFTVVRNPYDRFMSAFYYLKSGGISEVDIHVFKSKLEHIEDINEFVARLKADRELFVNTFNYIHFLPQSYFLEGNIRGVSIDHIGKQEFMVDTYKVVKEALNVNGSGFQYENKTPKYSTYMTEEVKDFIYEIYKKDFLMFGYEK